MAGADVTMLCSALMRHGITHIQRIEMDLVAWLKEHGHNSLARTQRRDESKELPGSESLRARAIRAWPLELYFAISNASVIARHTASDSHVPRPAASGLHLFPP